MRMADRTKARKKTFISLENYEPADAKYLWKPYIPLGFVTIIEGDPGVGKSWLTLVIAAAVSNGGGLPGQRSVKKGRVLIMSAEDDPHITLRPRLDACGGDPRMVYYATEHFTFDETGLETLRRNIREHRPLLVIVDPIVAYIGGDVDLHRANETRGLFTKLAKMASRYRCSLVVVRHLTKSLNDNATYRGIGSIDIIASVRSALLVDKDLDDPKNIRAVIHHKANLSHHGKTLLYEVKRASTRPGSIFKWKGSAAYDITEYMAKKHRDPGAPDDKRQNAMGLLTKLLETEPKLATEIEAMMDAGGVAARTLKRAKRDLGITSKKIGDVWYWQLP